MRSVQWELNGLTNELFSEAFISCLPAQIQSTSVTSALFREALKVTQSTANQKDAKTPIGQTVGTFNKLRMVVGAPSPYWIVGSPLIQVRSAVKLNLANAHSQAEFVLVGMNYDYSHGCINHYII